MSKWVYTFGNGHAEGDATMRNLLGGKGANLAEMNKVGLPVPPGFTVTTEVCTYYYNNNKTYPADLKDQVREAVAGVEKIMGKKFADANNPLLFSVRSGVCSNFRKSPVLFNRNRSVHSSRLSAVVGG